MYFAHISLSGPVKYGQLPGSIGAPEAPNNFMPIRMATCKTWDVRGLAV